MRETMPLPFLASSAIFVKEDKKSSPANYAPRKGIAQQKEFFGEQLFLPEL